MRTRLVTVMALVVGLGLLAAPQPEAQPVPGPLVRLQLRVTTSSDWSSIELHGLTVRARHTASSTSVDTLWVRTTGWSVVRKPGTPEAAVVLDLFAQLSPHEVPRVTVGKGREGATRVEVLAANTGVPHLVTNVVLDTQDPFHNSVRADIDRAGLVQHDLVLPEVDPRNLALAFYYPWFGPDTARDPKVWPDKPGSWHATTDRQHVTGMVDQAVRAGLDGFVVSWEGALHAPMVDLLVEEVAARPGFALAPLLELRAQRTQSLLWDRFDAGKAGHALADFLRRVPAANRLEVQGRPVVVVFGLWDLSPAEWAAFRAEVAALNPFVIADRQDPAMVTEGLYHYDPNPYTIDELAARYEASLDRARLQPSLDPAGRPLLWAATVSPGFDNGGSNFLLGRRQTERHGGWRYDETWRVALASRPEWVFVTSWNEWYEQTHISPGTATGSRALEQTATWTPRLDPVAP